MNKPTPNPEEVRANRRRISEQHKRDVLAEIDAAKANNESVGDILRREGIYSSTVYKWRQQLAKPTNRGRKAKSQEARRIAELEKENAKLQQKLADYEALTEAQGKVSALCVSRMNGRNEVVRTINAA